MVANFNPFVVYGHIPENLFCDREKESERLLSFLNNQQNVVLSAVRRMGKSKLIEHVFERPEIADNYITISIDILDTNSLGEFVFSLGNAVFDRVARKSAKLLKQFALTLKSIQASFGYDPIQNTPTFDIKLGELTQPVYTLKEIFDYLDKADKRCLVVIDEFQQITNYPEKNVEATLRTYMQQTRNVNFVFAGSQRRIMSEMFGSEKRPFYNSARGIDMDAIPLDVYMDFVQRLFRENGKDIETEAIAYVYDQFKGVTLYNQQIMNDAFAATPQNEKCDRPTVEVLVDNFVQENDKRIREILQFVSDNQKAVLYAICEDEPIKAITSGAFTKKHHLKSASSTQNAVKALLRADLITRHDDMYSVSDPLLDLWLKERV